MKPNPTLTDRILSAQSSPRIAEIEPQQFYLLICQLAAVQCRTAPSPEVTAIIRDMLISHFGWVKMDDMTIAVSMNAAGQFDQKLEAYGEFSAAFLGAVLKAYQPIKGKVVAESLKINDQSRMIEAPKLKHEDWMRMAAEHKAWKDAGKDNWQIFSARLIDYLYSANLASDDLWTDAQWVAFKAKAKHQVMERRDVSIGMVERMAGPDKRIFKQEVAMEMRTLLYGDWLDRFAVGIPDVTLNA